MFVSEMRITSTYPYQYLQDFMARFQQEELMKLRSKETEAKHSYEMLTQSLQADG